VYVSLTTLKSVPAELPGRLAILNTSYLLIFSCGSRHGGGALSCCGCPQKF